MVFKKKSEKLNDEKVKICAKWGLVSRFTQLRFFYKKKLYFSGKSDIKEMWRKYLCDVAYDVKSVLSDELEAIVWKVGNYEGTE